MTSLDFLQPLYEHSPLETGSDGHMADFWISLAFEHFEESDDDIFDEEQEGPSHCYMLTLDETLPVSNDVREKLLARAVSPATACNTVHDSPITSVTNTQSTDVFNSKQYDCDVETTSVSPYVCEPISTMQARQTRFTVQDDTSDKNPSPDTSVEASVDSLENGSKVDIPHTIANAESKPVHSSSTTQAGGQQLVGLAGSRNSLTETSHCKVVPGICTIASPQSEHGDITNSACLTVCATQQQSKRRSLPTTTSKRRIAWPIRGDNKRRRLTHEGTQDTIHHSQVVLKRDPEVFVRLQGGQVMVLGVESTTSMPVKWNRREKQYVVEIADDIWSFKDSRNFTWMSVTLQVGGDGHAVNLAYKDEMWIGWDAVTSAAIAVTADALAMTLLKPWEMNCVVWRETYTD